MEPLPHSERVRALAPRFKSSLHFAGWFDRFTEALPDEPITPALHDALFEAWIAEHSPEQWDVAAAPRSIEPRQQLGPLALIAPPGWSRHLLIGARLAAGDSLETLIDEGLVTADDLADLDHAESEQP